MVGTLLYVLVAVLVALWVFTFIVAHVGSIFVHLFLVAAAILFAYNVILKRKNRI